MTGDSDQLEFDFFRQPSEFETDGLDHWRQEMRAQDEAEARRLGLPLRRQVEVQLESGALLSGRLEFADAELLRLTRRPAKLSLRVGTSVFDYSQIARCIVLD
ncbi:MAG: hypothetical protein ACKV19_16915 [Verrucomicrobiales bacterium]